jgi:hypothetical protein
MTNNCESNRITWLDHEATITINYPDPGHANDRVYTLHTNAELRDDQPLSCTFSESRIRVRSGNSRGHREHRD